MAIQNAQQHDAKDLAYLINLAGEGLPEYIWSGMVEGTETPLDVGIRRASRSEGGFSYKNAKVLKIHDHVAGMIIDYQLDNPYVLGELNDYPEVIRPLLKLEALVPGSWYINAIATYEKYRRQGIAKQLVKQSEQHAIEQNIDTISLIVASENTIAKQFYFNLGYTYHSSLPIVKYPQSIHGGDWELLIKPLDRS